MVCAMKTKNTTKKTMQVKFNTLADALVDENLRQFRSARKAAKKAVDLEVLADQVELVKGQIAELDRLLMKASGEELGGEVVMVYAILEIVLVGKVGK